MKDISEGSTPSQKDYSLYLPLPGCNYLPLWSGNSFLKGRINQTVSPFDISRINSKIRGTLGSLPGVFCVPSLTE